MCLYLHVYTLEQLHNDPPPTINELPQKEYNIACAVYVEIYKVFVHRLSNCNVFNDIIRKNN